jgi:hypothetical protein
MKKIMDDHTRRLFCRKIPTLIVTALILLVGTIARMFAG